jgi:hypothetical protein
VLVGWPGAGAAAQPAVAAAVAGAEGDWAVADVGARAPQLAVEAAVPEYGTTGVCGCWRPFILHACGKSEHGWTYSMCPMLIHYNLPYSIPLSIWSPGQCLAFEASTDPAETSAQDALAPHQTTDQEASADFFMVM